MKREDEAAISELSSGSPIRRMEKTPLAVRGSVVISHSHRCQPSVRFGRPLSAQMICFPAWSMNFTPRLTSAGREKLARNRTEIV